MKTITVAPSAHFNELAALRAAIEEGEASGYIKDFDPEAHLEELKAKRRGNV